MKPMTSKITPAALATLITLTMLINVFGLPEDNKLLLLYLAIIIYFSNSAAKQSRCKLLAKGYFQNFIYSFRFNTLIVALSMISFFILTSYIVSTITSQPENFLTAIHVETRAESLFASLANWFSASVVVSYGVLQYWKKEFSNRTKTLDDYLKHAIYKTANNNN